MKPLGKRYAGHRSHLGLPPGTIGVGETKPEIPVEMTLFSYNAETLEEHRLADIRDLESLMKKDRIHWINIDGLHDDEVFRYLLEKMKIHPLVLEDISNIEHRPKADYLDHYNFIILKMLYREEEADESVSEQVSLILGENYVISFQEKKGDVFDPIRERLRTAKGRIRHSGADYLAYSLMDAVTDNYFVLLETLGDYIEVLEDELSGNPAKSTLNEIHGLKRDLIQLRHSIWPLREVVSFMQREESPLVSESIKPYLRDLYDHTIQVMDTVESYRDMVSGMIDLYMSGVSNRMNEVMKVLTVISTIFIPLSFVAGIYGMNFSKDSSPFNMPELSWRYGYFFALGIMALIAAVMLLFFKKKKWF